MKFTQISTLALAAMMAFSSCSKEEVMDSGEANLQPGEAQIVLDLGRKGATTYSTKLAEKAIKNGNAKLFTEGGIEIPMNETAIGANGVLNATVSAENVTKGAGPVTLYIFLNAASVANGAGTTAKDKYDAGTVATVINRDLTNGAPAGLSVDFTLTPGSNTIKAKNAKRAIARVGATNMSNEIPIDGFTIAFDGVNQTKGAIFDGSVTDGALVALPAYTLANSGLVKDTTMYSGNETVAYMYPSATVTATVTSPDGLEKKVSFAPKANMNYSIKINPKKPASGPGDIDFTVSIDEWVDAGDDMEVDFNDELSKIDKPVNPAAITPATGLTLTGTNVITAVSNGVGTATEFVDIADFFGAGITIDKIAVALEAKTYSDISGSFDPAVSADKRMKCDSDGTTAKFSLMPNNTGATLNYDLKISYTDGATKAKAYTIVKFSQPAIKYHPNFSVQMGAYEWMTINTQNTGILADDIAVLEEIEKTPGADFNAKMIAYAATNLPRLAGNFSRASIEGVTGDALNCKVPTCPVGYAVPASRILRSEFFGIGGTWTQTTESIFGAEEVPIGTIFNPGTTTLEKTVFNTYTFTKLSDNRNGYLTLRDPKGNVAIAFWRGQMSNKGDIVNPHISGYITSTENNIATTTGTERTIIGINITKDYGEMAATTTINTGKNSSLVRCVKQTPDMYWGN